MGRKSKQKGARGEREVAAMLNSVIARLSQRYGVLHDKVQRTSYMQANKGGDDLCGVEWASIEVKRHEKIIPSKLRDWWAQTCGQATRNRVPILLYRRNHEPWRARVRVYGEQVIEYTEEQFLEWFERAHEHWLTELLASA